MEESYYMVVAHKPNTNTFNKWLLTASMTERELKEAIGIYHAVGRAISRAYHEYNRTKNMMGDAGELFVVSFLGILVTSQRAREMLENKFNELYNTPIKESPIRNILAKSAKAIATQYTRAISSKKASKENARKNILGEKYANASEFMKDFNKLLSSEWSDLTFTELLARLGYVSASMFLAENVQKTRVKDYAIAVLHQTYSQYVRALYAIQQVFAFLGKNVYKEEIERCNKYIEFFSGLAGKTLSKKLLDELITAAVETYNLAQKAAHLARDNKNELVIRTIRSVMAGISRAHTDWTHKFIRKHLI